MWNVGGFQFPATLRSLYLAAMATKRLLRRYNHSSKTLAHDPNHLCQQRFLSDDTTKKTKRRRSHLFFVDESMETECILAEQLSKLLDCSSEEAGNIYLTVPRIREVSVDNLSKYVLWLKNKGFTTDIIVANPWLLTFDQYRMRPRINLLNRIRIDETTVALLKISPRFLSEVSNKWLSDQRRLGRSGNRLQYLSDQLRCPPAEVADIAVRHPYLLTNDFEQIMRILKMLMDHGITGEAIRDDPWLLRNNDNVIEDRLTRAKDAGMFSLKTWLLHCPEDVFVDILHKWRTDKNILRDYDDTVGYLSHRLAISRDHVLHLGVRNSQLLTTSVAKLKSVIDLILANGISSSDLCRHPRVFNHNIVTLERRLQELNAIGNTIKNLEIACQSAKRYKARIAKISAEKNLTPENSSAVIKTVEAEPAPPPSS